MSFPGDISHKYIDTYTSTLLFTYIYIYIYNPYIICKRKKHLICIYIYISVCVCVFRGLACVTSQTCSAGRIAKSAEPGRGQIFVAPGLGFAEKRAPSVDIHLPIIKLYLKYLYIIIYIYR